MMPRPVLSVLDATAIGPGVDACQAVRWTTDVARTADALGYARLWVVEHHAAVGIGGSSPAVLLAHLCASTGTLRLGAGGVMLPNHAPLLIAEQFALLQALHPGRIDLGIGRAHGGVPAVARALRSQTIDDSTFEAWLDELNGFLERRFPPGHAYEHVRLALDVPPPPLFILGAGEGSASAAARRALPFACAHHLRPQATRAALSRYRREFHASPAPPDQSTHLTSGSSRETRPWSIMTVAVVCAETREEAEQAALATAMLRLRCALTTERGLDIDDETLAGAPFTDAERSLAARELSGDWIVVGERSSVARELTRLAATNGADEVMLSPFEQDGPGRVRTLRDVAHAFDLRGEVAHEALVRGERPARDRSARPAAGHAI